MSEHMEDSDDPDRKVDSPTYPHTLFRQVVQKLKSYKDESSQTDLKMIGDASLDHREKTVQNVLLSALKGKEKDNAPPMSQEAIYRIIEGAMDEKYKYDQSKAMLTSRGRKGRELPQIHLRLPVDAVRTQDHRHQEPLLHVHGL